MPKKKEKRDAVLYAMVKPSNKEFAEDDRREKGYSTLSEYIDDMLEENKVAANWVKKGKKK